MGEKRPRSHEHQTKKCQQIYCDKLEFKERDWVKFVVSYELYHFYTVVFFFHSSSALIVGFLLQFVFFHSSTFQPSILCPICTFASAVSKRIQWWCFGIQAIGGQKSKYKPITPTSTVIRSDLHPWFAKMLINISEKISKKTVIWFFFLPLSKFQM